MAQGMKTAIFLNGDEERRSFLPVAVVISFYAPNENGRKLPVLWVIIMYVTVCCSNGVGLDSDGVRAEGGELHH